MSTTKVTKTQAKKVLAAVRAMFPDGDFTLRDNEHEDQPKGCWSIACEGIYDWPFQVTEKRFTDPDSFPGTEAVFLEPMNGWCLALYPR